MSIRALTRDVTRCPSVIVINDAFVTIALLKRLEQLALFLYFFSQRQRSYASVNRFTSSQHSATYEYKIILRLTLASIKDMNIYC
jgi:hypothetical protein